MALILSECTHHANQLNHEDSRFDMVLSSLLNIMETAGIHFEITMKRGHTHAMWLVTAEKSFTLVETHVSLLNVTNPLQIWLFWFFLFYTWYFQEPSIFSQKLLRYIKPDLQCPLSHSVQYTVKRNKTLCDKAQYLCSKNQKLHRIYEQRTSFLSKLPFSTLNMMKRSYGFTFYSRFFVPGCAIIVERTNLFALSLLRKQTKNLCDVQTMLINVISAWRDYKALWQCTMSNIIYL